MKIALVIFVAAVLVAGVTFYFNNQMNIVKQDASTALSACLGREQGIKDCIVLFKNDPVRVVNCGN